LDLVEGDQALIEAELTEVFGAAPHDRSAERSAQRNGHRARILTTTAGDLELRIAKLRTGSFFPSLLERLRRVDQVGAFRGRSLAEESAVIRAWVVVVVLGTDPPIGAG
jgi:hypothetical protein